MSSSRQRGQSDPADPLSRLNASLGRRRVLFGLVVAVLGPALVTAMSGLPSGGGTAVPALLYLLSVVAAAVIGRLWPAMLAATLSFVGLDYFFTPPTGTFTVGKAEDLVALGIFLLVAILVSAAISAALDQRATAVFRERQVRTLYHVDARLLSGDAPEGVLEDLAGVLRMLYGLAGCRVLVADDAGTLLERSSVGTLGEEVHVVPLVAEGREVGRIEMGGPSTRLDLADRQIMAAFAGQLALALERVRLGREAQRARLDAEGSRVRAALFSSVTHDLRTPLASITASASSLLEEGVPFSNEQRRELLRTILEESERLNRLVANLMDISRLRAGAMTPSVETVPMDEVISTVVDRLRPTLQGRPVRILIREDLPPVPMDVVQIDQVLTNLVENAVRYSPPGSEIAITAVRWADSVEVRVADRGPGIPAEERARVFQEFYRRDVGGRRGGSGLGLAIAQAMVSAHGGEMWIEETPGGGATVGLRLPARRRARATTGRTPS